MLISLRAQPTTLRRFFESRSGQRQTRLWIELGIMCEAIVRQHKIYSQIFSRVLNFLIATVNEFSQGSDGTRKRRIAECFGSFGWTSVHPRELRESEDRRSRLCSPRAIASRRGRQSSGAGRLPHGYARAVNGRDGGQASFVTTCLPVDPPSSLRSAADRTGNGLALGPRVDRKVRLGSVPERSGV
jgi:hypothetical protein